MEMTEDFAIRPFQMDVDSIDELTRLLNVSYKQLSDLGLRYLATHQDSTITRERIDGAHCLIALKDNRIIGTISFYKPGMKHGCPWYERDTVGVVGQYAVHPDYQGLGLGTLLLNRVETYAFQTGLKELALDTAEPAAHLRSIYEKKGYRFIEFANWDVTNYRSVILSKTLPSKRENTR
ncbi:histone acetyltransferase HPA2 [Bacillus sp. JCM 19046]|nr:histone acetyltransferase HPA2 [Bacillus sp. JCM 19045]GAF16970.1 histone acetyltransferase HPA2 [Bacillus sp. JCM 19046]